METNVNVSDAKLVHDLLCFVSDVVFSQPQQVPLLFGRRLGFLMVHCSAPQVRALGRTHGHFDTPGVVVVVISAKSDSAAILLLFTRQNSCLERGTRSDFKSGAFCFISCSCCAGNFFFFSEAANSHIHLIVKYIKEDGYDVVIAEDTDYALHELHSLWQVGHFRQTQHTRFRDKSQIECTFLLTAFEIPAKLRLTCTQMRGRCRACAQQQNRPQPLCYLLCEAGPSSFLAVGEGV